MISYFDDILKTKTAAGIALAISGSIKKSEDITDGRKLIDISVSRQKSAIKISLSKLFMKVAASINIHQYKNMEYFMKDNDHDDICLTMKLEPNVCKETLELFGK